VDLFPAIDIRSGRVVRLSQGEATRQTVYGDDPAQVAERFAGQGAGWIHVVDLDRAFGEGQNDEPVRRILAAVGGRVRIQLGGGLRTLDRVRRALDLGVSRLVIGTAAATDPGFLASAAIAAPPGRLAVGVDGGTAGWRSGLEGDGSLRRGAGGAGGRRRDPPVIYTDVSRDGMLLLIRLRCHAAASGAATRSGGVTSLSKPPASWARGRGDRAGPAEARLRRRGASGPPSRRAADAAGPAGRALAGLAAFTYSG
jgi:phosphoribosylformimino-5-aminoimidazole carboxamide ribonucleotide (ProFAR) isomerase